jgi:hypothetical protein
MTVKKTTKVPEVIAVDPGFDLVVAAFAKDHQVSHEDGKGFGSGALKVNGKVFAMKSSKGKFVVKLPKERVDALAASGQGERFDPVKRKANEGVASRGRPRSELGSTCKGSPRFCEALKSGVTKRCATTKRRPTVGRA